MRPIREIGTPTGVDPLPGGSPTISLHRPTLVQTIAKHADQRPDHPALVQLPGGESLDYGRLLQRVERLAQVLRGHGIGPEDRVGILLDRSIDQIVTLLAVLDTGAAFVPLDPRYPRERLESMADDADCRWIVSKIDDPRALGEASTRNLDLQAQGVELLDFDRLRQADPPLPPRPSSTRGLAEATAYVVFTSGSTGRPKGVMIPHRALDWYSQTCGRHYGLGPDDRLLQLASASFDISIGEIFPTLASGATLLLAPPGPVDAVELLATCSRHRVTVLFPATALWHELARALAEDPERLPSSLRLVSFGGEKVAANRLADWRRAVGGRVLLINGYGPTETTVEATLHRLTSAMISAEPGEAQAIGRPVDGVNAQVVDPLARPVDPGAPGELWLDSPGLARGYLHRPALTAECFVPDPEGRRRGGRVYRTGDLVRQRPDGCFEILGRRDRQTKIRGFRIEPAEIEHQLRQHPGVAEAAVVVLDSDSEGDDADDRWLAAFAGRRGGPGPRAPVSNPGRGGATGILGVGSTAEEALDERRLRSYLRDRLPSHLVPQAIHVLDRLPLDGNLKIDRRALEARALAAVEPSGPRVGPSGDGTAGARGGHSAAEALLTELWRRVLRVSSVAPGDDYFALGGDSILGIRIAAQAQRSGLPITPRDLFDHPKLASLAALAERRAASRSPTAETLGPAEPAVGHDLPLTPVQRWFFDEAVLDRPWHFNQSLMVTVEGRVEAPMLERALHRMVEHHAALRMRFRPDPEGRIRQRVAEVEPRRLLLHLDLSAVPEGRRRKAFERAADQVQGSFDLAQGPLLGAALVWGLGRPRLLLAIHHLVVDGVSWGILLGDLEALVLDELEGRGPRPLAEGTSYARWALLQTHLARSGAFDAEVPLWTTQKIPATPLPCDLEHGDGNSLASEARVSRGLEPRATHALLRRAGEAYRTHINDLLLTALAMTVGRWTGGPLWVDLEGHGREELAPGLDLSRTVGWFTSTFPVAVELSGLAASDLATPFEPSATELATWLPHVKEILRRFPNHGIGFGILHDLADGPSADAVQALPRPEISFNYLGQLDALLAESRLFTATGEGRGREKGRGGRRPYLFEIDGGVVDGRLWINWTYSRNRHHRSTVEALAESFNTALETLIDHCLDPASGALTPSDVPLARLDATTLTQRFPNPREIEDLYPLAPMQEGMLFHSLLEPESPIYLEQASWEVVGPFDPEAFRAAWQRVLDRHAVLRTAFRWRGLDPPLQVVYRHCRLPWGEEDWSPLPAGEHESRFEELLATDRRLGFELDHPPLTRVTLVRLGGQRHRFLWTYHHALLDGWSISVLLDEVFALLPSSCSGTAPPERAMAALRAPTPFRDYVAYTKRAERDGTADRDEAAQFFRRDLAGFTEPTPLPVAPTRPSETLRNDSSEPLEVGQGETTSGQETLERLLDDDLGQSLERFTRHHRVTAGTVVQAAWGLLLGRAQNGGVQTEESSGAAPPDVLFGMTVSSRPADLAGAETIVGPMINTLPVRLHIPNTGARIEWLRSVQDHVSELRQHSQGALVDLRRWAEVPAGRDLFETLLVFENYPVEHGALEEEQRRGDLTLRDYRGFCETNYPLMLTVVPGRRWRFELAWTRHRLSQVDALWMLDQLEHLLRELVVAPDAPLAALDLGVSAGHRPRPSTPPKRSQSVPEATPGGGPPTVLDDRVEALWREVLGCGRCGPEADFFELGGHSLKAMGLLARLRQELGAELPLQTLFDQSTLGALSARVGEVLRQRGDLESADPDLTTVVTEERPEHPPLASNQRRLWILDRLEPGDPAYHLAGGWDVRGTLDPAALDAALQAVVDRHEALRTLFPEHRGEPYQEIRPADGRGSRIPHVDLRRLGDRAPDEARRQADRLALLPFDLGRGPLLRMVRMELEERRSFLIKVVHHIVSDATSESLFYRELALFYRAARRQRPVRLPTLEAQPADAVPWQNRRWPEATWRPRLEALAERLSDLPTLELPRDRTRERPHRVGHLQHRLPRAATASLARLAASHRASLAMLLTAGLAALLRRLGAGDDLVLGSPVANRPTPEHGAWIGFFVETVILRLELDGKEGFGATLDQVREVALEAWSHQDVPFDRLVERLAPPRRPGRPPLAQVMVDWVETPHTTLPLDGARGRWFELAGSSGSYDLALTGSRNAGRIVLDLEFDAGRYDATSARRWARALERMLTAAFEDPTLPLDALPWLSRAERHQLLIESEGDPRTPSDTELPSPLGLSTGLAVIDGARGKTHDRRWLGRRITVWRRTIEDAGLGERGRETTVAVLAERSPEGLAASLGVMAAGAVWLPLDPEDPPAHQRAVMEANRVAGLLGARDQLLPLAQILGNGWSLPPDPSGENGSGDDGSGRDGSSGDFVLLAPSPTVPGSAVTPAGPGTPHDPRRAAAILHTSGSTGEPKGVVLTWGGLAGYAADAARRYQIGPESRVLQFAHWTFDLWLEEVLPTLLVGATLVLRDPETATAEGFWRFCLRHRVTHASLPTAFWHRLVDALPDEIAALPDAVTRSSLRHLVLGGQKLDPERRRRWSILGQRARGTALGSLVLHDTYGPTEATVVCARARPLSPGEAGLRPQDETGLRPQGETGLRPQDETGLRPDGELGRPIAGARLLVVEPSLEPSPLGVAGELAIAGPGVARGYRGQGAATARRFVPDPSADGSTARPAGGRLYLTGDRCRRLADGSLQFLGRLDRQLKIRGFRVEPATIEATLRRLSELRDAVVGAHTQGGTTRLVAWTVATDPADPPSVETLRAHCAGRLPQHLHPTVWVSVDQLPLDRRGKLDRHRLPAPDLGRPSLETIFRPPSGATEETLARVWCEVLDLETLGADDDFFDLGGDSLLAIRATDGVRRSGFALEPMDLLRHPTVARLAQVVVELSQLDDPETVEVKSVVAGSGESRSGLESSAVPDVADSLAAVPLTPIQRWFFDWRLEQRHHFNQSFRLVARHPLDPVRVERAVAELLTQHETLRLRFDRVSDHDADRGAEAWRQHQVSTRRATQTLGVVTVDLSRLPSERAQAELSTLCATLQASLDLGHGPLLRVATFKLPKGPEKNNSSIEGVQAPLSHGARARNTRGLARERNNAREDAWTAECGSYFSADPEGGDQLLMVVHHLLIDGVSWPILLEDFEAAYGHPSTPATEAPRLPPSTTPYHHWAAALVERAGQRDALAELPYWRDVLNRRQPLPLDPEPILPEDGARRSVASWVERRLDPRTTERLLRDGRRVEPRLLTAVLRAVTAWSGRSGLLLELESHGRGLAASSGGPRPMAHGPELDASRTLGWFTSTFPVWLERAEGDLESQVEALARQLAEVPARGFHFGLLRYLAPEVDGVAELRSLQGPEINFNYLGRVESSLSRSALFEPHSLDPGPEQGDRGESLHLFDVGCRVVAGELVVDWAYDPLRIRRETAETLSAYTLDDLRRIAEIRTR